MKWKIINNGFSPQFKCGAELAGAGVMNLLGGMGNTMIQKEVADEQIYYQMLENQKNRDWQTSQAELNRQFQTNQQNVAFGQQQQLQTQQQQYNLQSMAQQAKYNSPIYQRRQLEAAGINPQVYFGSKGSFVGSSPVSGGAPSAPSPASGSMPGSVSGLSPVSYQPRALDVAAIAGAMKNFAEAELNDQRKLTESSQQKVNESITRLNDSLEKLNDKEYERYGIFLHYYENMLQEQLNNLRADTGLKGTESQKNVAETQTEDELRQWRVNLAKEDISKVRSEISKIDISNKAIAIDNLRKLTGLSDAVWNDIWNKIKLKTGAVNREALEKYLFEYDLP